MRYSPLSNNDPYRHHRIQNAASSSSYTDEQHTASSTATSRQDGSPPDVLNEDDNDDNDEDVVYSAFDNGELKSIDLSGDGEKLRIRNSLLSTPTAGGGGNFFSNYTKNGRFSGAKFNEKQRGSFTLGDYYKYILLFLTFALNVNSFLPINFMKKVNILDFD
jgi:hypothetical protein